MTPSPLMNQAEHVKAALLATRDLRGFDAAKLKANPSVLPTLRMCMALPFAEDRLIRLGGLQQSPCGPHGGR